MNFKNALFLVVFTVIFNFAFSQEKDTLRKVDIEKVTVKAFRVNSNFSDLPHKVEVLKSNDIEQIPSESVTEILKKTSSVDVIQYPSMKSQIGMRGFSPSAHSGSYTVMLVNGLPAGTENPSTLGIENAEQVEVMKGPFSSFFGSGAMAGVVNIVTPRSKGEIEGSAGLEYGSFQTRKVKASGGGSLTDNLNFDISASYGDQGKDYQTGSNNLLDTDKTEENIIGEDTRNERFQNTTYQKFNSGLRVGYEINENWQVHSYTDVFLADDVFSNGTFWGVYGDLQKEISRWSQSIHFEGKLDNHSLKIAPYFGNQQMKYYNEVSDTNFVDTKKNFKEYGFIAQDAVKIGSHELILGMDNHSRQYSAQRWEDKQTQAAPYNPDYLNMTTGLFMQAKMKFFDDKLVASAGGRFDHIFLELYDTDYMEHETGKEQHFNFNPKIGLQYTMKENFKLHSSYGTAFIAPDAFQKAGSYSYTSSYGTSTYKGNPDLKPEHSETIDAGVGYNNRNFGISSDLSFFYSQHEDMIVYDRSNENYTSFDNANKAKMKGMEIMFSYDLGAISDYSYSLKFYANLTHLFESKINEGENEKYENMKYVRKNNGSFGVEYRNFEGAKLRLNSRFIGHRYENNWLGRYDLRTGLENADELKHPQFLVFDLSGSYTFFGKYKLGIKAQNIFDEIYTEKDGYYMPGRTITGSFTYKF